MMKMLAKVGFSQSYTYFTWRESRADLEANAVKFTWPFLTKLFTSGPAVTIDGNIGKIGFLHSSIFL